MAVYWPFFYKYAFINRDLWSIRPKAFRPDESRYDQWQTTLYRLQHRNVIKLSLNSIPDLWKEVNRSERSRWSYSRHKAKKTWPIYSHIDRTNLANKGFIIWLNRECFQAGATQKIPSGEDRHILAARGFSQIINVHVVFETLTFWQQKRKLLSGRITEHAPSGKMYIVRKSYPQ